MAFRSVGLGARLTFEGGAAIAGMTKAGLAAQSMSARFTKAKASASLLARGMKTLAIAGTAVTVALGIMTAKAAGFQQQMANVKAVAITATTEELAAMTQQAKQLGATTAFTAVQAGEAMELLTRAGFNAAQVMSAVPAVLNAAAAEGMDLATATDIVAGSLRIMNLQAEDAARVADVLASTSALSNTNIVMLGESFKYGGQQASMLGFTLEETSSMFGALANQALKGSSAGTALSAMLRKMVDPSSKATKFMKKYEIVLTEVSETGEKVFKKMPQLVKEYSAALSAIEDPAERAAMATELFGRQGARAWDALQKTGSDALEQLQQQLERSQGAARRMAEIRMDTFIGQLTLLRSAMEGFSNEIGSILLPTLTAGVKQASKFISDLAIGLGILLNPAKANTKEAKAQAEMWGTMGSTAQKVVKGMVSGIQILRGWWSVLRFQISRVADLIGSKLGDEGTEKISKIITVVLGVAAVVGPLILALGAGFVVVSAAVSVTVGALGILSAMFLPLIAVVGAFALVVMAVKRENESTWGAIMRIVKGVWNFFKGFYEGVKAGFMEMWGPIKAVAMPLLDELKTAFKKVAKIVKGFFKDSGLSSKQWGKILGKTIGVTVGKIIKGMIIGLQILIEIFRAVGVVVGFVASIIVTAFRVIFAALKGVYNFVAGAFIAVWNSLKTVVSTVIGAIMGSIRGWWGLIKKVYNFIKDKLAGVWNVVSSAAKTAMDGITTAINGALNKVEKLILRIKFAVRKTLGLGGKNYMLEGQSGPLPVMPGPTPPVAAAPQINTPDTSIAGASEGAVVVHTHIMLDGREVAQSVESYKMERRVRSTEISAGELREFAQLTAA